ncbi:MAG: CDP-archaeol synthase [Candidatus Parcubacteria bacterium]|jgi:CDP-2,3-bis-(O-geranylgeranyl)-sn-glycerol synthase
MSYLHNTQLLVEILTFAVPCWITNMSFQFIRAVKDRVPKNHWVRKYNVDNFDFIFIDGKPFVGSGIRISSIIPILILPSIFNFFIPISYTYYALLTFSVFLGDLLGSFIKRRFDYPKGKFMPIIDHGDYILFTGIFFILLDLLSYKIFFITLFITYLIHPLTCYVGYQLGIKKEML